MGKALRLFLALAAVVSGGTAVAQNNPFPGMTISFAIYAKDAQEQRVHINSSPSGLDLYVGAQAFSYVLKGATGRVSNCVYHPSALNARQRHAYRFVYDGETVEIYLNDQMIACHAARCGAFDTQTVRVAHAAPGALKDFKVEACVQHPVVAAAAPRIPPGIYAFSAMDWVHPGNFAAKLTAPATRVRFALARNEREHAQVFVVPEAGAVTNLVLRNIAPLKTSRKRRAPFTWRSYVVEHTAVPEPSHFMYAGMSIPDRLTPSREIRREGDRPFALWLEIQTPEDAEPGVYAGEIEFVLGRQIRRLPLEVRVYGFALPRENTVPTLINLWERDILTYAKGDAARFLDLVRQYCELLVDHRMNPIYLHEPDLIVDPQAKALYPQFDDGAVNWEAFDNLTAHLLKRGMSRFVAGPYYRSPAVWRNTANKERAWRETRQHLDEKGWLARAVAYCIDEWGESDLGEAKNVGASLKEWAPGMAWTITGANNNYPAPDRLPDVDIWLPQLHWVNPVAQVKEQQRGREVWYYVCTGPQFPAPNLHADTPLAAIRMVPGFGLRFGFDGFLHWGANFNTGRHAKPTSSYEYGEGTYVLPDEKGEPLATCRFKALSDGIEDWMAFKLLKTCDPKAAEKFGAQLAQLVSAREYDKTAPVELHKPWEGSYGTFFDRESFYGIYSQPELYLRWRESLYARLEKIFKNRKGETGR